MTASKKSGATKKRRRPAAPVRDGVASSSSSSSSGARHDGMTVTETLADAHRHHGTNRAEARDDDDDDRRKGRKKVRTQTVTQPAMKPNGRAPLESDAIAEPQEGKEDEDAVPTNGRLRPTTPPPPRGHTRKRGKTRAKKSQASDATPPPPPPMPGSTAPPPPTSIAATHAVPPWELHDRWEKEAAAAAAKSDRVHRRSQAARDTANGGGGSGGGGSSLARLRRQTSGDQVATGRARNDADDPEAEAKEARKKYSAAHGSAAAIERYKTARETRRRESQSDGAPAAVRVLTAEPSAATRSRAKTTRGAGRRAAPTGRSERDDDEGTGREAAAAAATSRKKIVATAVRVLRRVGGDHCPECATPRPLRHHVAAGVMMCPLAGCGFTMPHHASLSALPVYVDESDQAHGLVEHVRKFRARLVPHRAGAQRVADLHMHAIRHELRHRNACTGAQLVKPIAIEQIICELGLPAPLLERAACLAALFSGQPFATFSDAECDALTQMYLEFRTAFARLRSKGANGGGDESAHGGGGGGGAASTTVTETSSAGNKFPLFNYYMYQFCIARRWYVRARTFPLFKERDALEEADRSYAPIARLLRWDFVRTV